MKLQFRLLSHILGTLLLALIFFTSEVSADTPCNELVSLGDQLLCQKKSIEGHIDELANIVTWQPMDKSRKYFHTLFQKEPQLIIRPGSDPFAPPVLVHLYNIPKGKVVLEEIAGDSASYAPKDEETHIKFKKHDNGESTLMLQLWNREAPNGTRVIRSDMLVDGNTTSTTTPSADSDINYPAAVIPGGLAIILHLSGWIMTVFDIYQTYYYNNGKGEPAPIMCRAASAVFTCFLNVIPHLLFFVKKRRI